MPNLAPLGGTQSVQDWVPTQSVGTRDSGFGCGDAVLASLEIIRRASDRSPASRVRNSPWKNRFPARLEDHSTSSSGFPARLEGDWTSPNHGLVALGDDSAGSNRRSVTLVDDWASPSR